MRLTSPSGRRERYVACLPRRSIERLAHLDLCDINDLARYAEQNDWLDRHNLDAPARLRHEHFVPRSRINARRVIDLCVAEPVAPAIQRMNEIRGKLPEA